MHITANQCKQLAMPLVAQLDIIPPRFHLIARFAQARFDAFGSTIVINNKPHVFINPSWANNESVLLATIAHELIHCWQFTTGVWFDPESQSFTSEQECENHAYTMEPIATAALAALLLTSANRQQAKNAA